MHLPQRTVKRESRPHTCTAKDAKDRDTSRHMDTAKDFKYRIASDNIHVHC